MFFFQFLNFYIALIKFKIKSILSYYKPPSMNYQGYIKIPSSTTDWKNPNNKNKKWIITKKVHSSCFCFCFIYDVNTNKITCAKRKEIIKDNEYFYGFRDILPELYPIVERIASNVLTRGLSKSISFINIYGELFGGVYPNIKSKYKPVQNGIYYSPNLHFYALIYLT
jgi:hypothetical protein